MTTEKRYLGGQGLAVSSMGLGCMGMTGSYGHSREDESIETIQKAIESGVDMFDTSDSYDSFANEELLGKAVAGRRDKVILATKFGSGTLDDEGNLVGGTNGRPDYVRACVERSLRNLGTDRIDLYYQHRVDPNVPVEETFGALGELVAAGKLRYLGICEAMPDTIRRAHTAAPLSAVQTEYSLFSRDVETNGVLDTVRDLGIGFVAYSPLSRGFLAGTVRSRSELGGTDLRQYFPRFDADNLAANLAVLDRVTEIADSHRIDTTRLALAWLLGQGTDIVPIPGTRRLSHLLANLEAAQTPLDDATMRALRAAVPAGAVAGDRVSPADQGIER
jgi:aryl-alcohol dehydrogenase-like predicted oxidoreductase